MSRLESSGHPRFLVTPESDETTRLNSLVAVPLTLRTEAIENFDKEFRIEEIGKNQKIKNASLHQDVNLLECLANASLLLKEGEYELAQSFYRSVLKINPNNELAIRGAAESAAAMGHHDEAIQVLRKLVEKHGSAENYKRLGDELYEMSHNQDAIQAYHQALKLSFFDGEELFIIYKNLGNICLRIGDANAAEEYYNKAYTLMPDSDVLLVNFGSLAIYRGEYDKALSRFREAVTINDKNDKAWVGLAMIHREYGDIELAWANIEKALDSNSVNLSAIKLISEWAMKDNEIERAITHLDAYLNVHPEDAEISMWYAKFLYFTGRLSDALVEIEKALHLEPHLEGGIEVLTVVKSELQNIEKNKND